MSYAVRSPVTATVELLVQKNYSCKRLVSEAKQTSRAIRRCVCVMWLCQAGCSATERTSEARKANTEEASSSSTHKQYASCRCVRPVSVDQQPVLERVERRQQRTGCHRLRRAGWRRSFPGGRLVYRTVRRTEAWPDGVRQRRGVVDGGWSDVRICHCSVYVRLTAFSHYAIAISIELHAIKLPWNPFISSSHHWIIVFGVVSGFCRRSIAGKLLTNHVSSSSPLSSSPSSRVKSLHHMCYINTEVLFSKEINTFFVASRIQNIPPMLSVTWLCSH